MADNTLIIDDLHVNVAGKEILKGVDLEIKHAEILQMAMLKPKMAILDETDSGLDIDAIKIVSDGINRLKNPEMGILIVTHYNRFLNSIRPDKVHILVDGKIARSGGGDLAEELDRVGY